MIPVAAQDPAAFWLLVDVLGQAPGKVHERSGLAKSHVRQGKSASEEMDVSVIEPGQDAPLPCINDSCARTGQSPNLLVRTDGNDAITEDGDSLGGRLGLVHRADAAVDEDDIRREGVVGQGCQDVRSSGYQ